LLPVEELEPVPEVPALDPVDPVPEAEPVAPVPDDEPDVLGDALDEPVEPVDGLLMLPLAEEGELELPPEGVVLLDDVLPEVLPGVELEVLPPPASWRLQPYIPAIATIANALVRTLTFMRMLLLFTLNEERRKPPSRSRLPRRNCRKFGATLRLLCGWPMWTRFR